MNFMKIVIIHTLLFFMEIVSEDLVYLKQKEWYKYLSPQTDKGLSNVVFSGPVIAIDSQTLFVTNIRTVSNYSSNLQFYVAIGTEKSFIEEENSNSSLRFYKNENIYLMVPNKWTTDAIEEFGVWSNTTNTVVTSIDLTFDKNEIRRWIGKPPKETDDRKQILRVPKCCKFKENLSTDGCGNDNYSTFEPNFTVFMNNETHLDDDPNNTVPYLFVPYIHFLQCNKAKIELDSTENVHFLINTSLITNVDKLQQIFTHDDFCLEENFVVVCVNLPTKIHWVAIIFIIISAISLAITAAFSWFTLKNRNIHSLCFIGYSSFMSIVFLLLTILQFTDSGCNIIGGFFIFFVMGAYLWLLVLCIDLFYMYIHISKDNKSIRRFIIYTFSTVLIALLLTIISVYDGTADVPNSFIKKEPSCDYSESKISPFFIPLGIIIISCMVLLTLIQYKIRKTRINNRSLRKNFYFMWRQTFIIWALITVFTILEFCSNVLYDSMDNSAIDVLLYSNGLFTFILVCGYQYYEIYKEKKYSAEEQQLEYF